ncbi:hypothetical protein [Hydrogenophaga sp.]|uniref:hypothetical protein n=1 Tax=Hydrogenophaga sp. TaxID=1904254 RepID=UPI003D13F211
MTQKTMPSHVLARYDGADAREVSIEHAALARQLASLQRRVSEQVRASARQVRGLEDEVLCLRAQLVLARTCLLWGLGVAAGLQSVPRRARTAVTAPAPTMAEASSVICQTGCVGHAHPWLEADGQCRRTGVACERYAGSASGVDTD